MDFSQFVVSGAPAMAEGAVVERVRRDAAVTLDPHIMQAGLVYDPTGRAHLAAIHEDYAHSARAAGLPLLMFTDTWRGSQHLIDASEFRGRPVNADNAHFLLDLRDRLGDGPPIFVGGLIGPSGDAYQPDDSLGRDAARAFHRPQVEALAAAGVDFLFLATAPNVQEALGAADAMAATGLPYFVSFVIRRAGTVLDGTPLDEAIARIDSEVAPAPTGFAVNCVHANVLGAALEAVATTNPGTVKRITLFQANAADMEPEDLDGSPELRSEPPDVFADGLIRVGRRFGLRILGGCCGSEGPHMEKLAARFACEGLPARPLRR